MTSHQNFSDDLIELVKQEQEQQLGYLSLFSTAGIQKMHTIKLNQFQKFTKIYKKSLQKSLQKLKNLREA
jgi:hypothetical protein